MFSLKVFSKYVILLLVLFTGFCFSPKVASANNLVIFEDNFDDGEALDWIVPINTCSYNGSPAKWQVVNLKYGMRINGGGCRSFTSPFSLSINDTVDYTLEVDMSFPNTVDVDRNLLFKYHNLENRYGLHFIGNKIIYEKVVGGERISPHGSRKTYNFQPDEEYHIIVEVNNQEIVVSINGERFSFLESDITFPNDTVVLAASAGEVPFSEVWFDNIKIKSLYPLFDLPIYYTGFEDSFRDAFWEQLTASFDHYRKGGKHIPFTGTPYKKNACPKGTFGIHCYDSHKGTDFSVPTVLGFKRFEVFPVAEGEVVFASEHDNDGCTPNKGGYGCVIILHHSDLNLYTLYAHLSKINVDTNDHVTDLGVKIADIGNTGCKPKCGEHLHFGVFKDIPDPKKNTSKKMTKKDWQELMYAIRPESSASPKHYCTYKAPNGNRFIFLDPSGWEGENPDPWEESCNTESPYLWKYDVGTGPEISTTNFFGPLQNFLNI